MSRPRAATSVHRRMSASPFLNFSRASSRWAWVRFPCISTAFSPRSPRTMANLCTCVLVSKNTMTSLRKVRASSAAMMASRLSSWDFLMRMNSCTRRPATWRESSTLTRTGLCRLRDTSCSTCMPIVAEKSRVWRRGARGQARMISSTSSWKPSSISRSTSSRTRISTSSRWNPRLLVRWSTSRPGVATTTSGRPRSSASCALRFLDPPTTSAHSVSVCWPSVCSMLKPCAASSRVGATTSTRVARTWRGR
mmetsp:Transcript_39652/g.68419  ORF Transcript_39652/g.68419 Transcript_39652/m.68419 type:complete len:251 (+) Transcript_39652:1230-1982(+)